MNRTCYILLFALCGSLSLTAQPGKPKYRTATRAVVNCDSIFPACFIGNWKGTLQWMVAGKPAREFIMRLNIQPADTAGQYNWQIIYGDDNKDQRTYLLRSVDETKGYWVIDEKDGIILDSYVHGNSLHGAFTVQGNTIVDNYKIIDGRMHVEFFSIKLDDKKRSGKGTTETPFVDSYNISSYQTGILLKVR
ncbi:MAG: hypothetical protein WAR78_11635 [Ferruginibacter sp.]